MNDSDRRHRRSSLYFVESVEQTNEGHVALLQYIPIDIQNWVDENKDFKWYISRTIPARYLDIVQEGNYVHLLNDEDFQNGANDERVVKIMHRNHELHAIADRLSVLESNIPEFNDITSLYSYHINVGHGNFSLLVFVSHGQTHIWMVDGSSYDYRNRRNHYAEIDSCFQHIIIKFNLPDNPHIDIVMITHAHYDHYSGIPILIDKGYIDSNTFVFLNRKRNVMSHNFNNLVSKLNYAGATIIQPFVQNSTPNINILYPDINTFSSSLKINNTSSVYCIRFDGLSYFVFPGDLETEGWDLMNTQFCYPYLKEPKYYAISHHGSLNGHLRHHCNMRNTNSIATCLSSETKTVLMGRDKAFSGIYSPKVLTDFSGRIYYSEKDRNMNSANFLEIDLISATETWY